MNKILTIVIPTYNMENYLRKCLESLIIENKELFRLLEVLVVNDGSKDSSSTIAHEYQDKYPNVFRVIDKENGNYGSCVNRGLKDAKGKYIKILDADDSFNTKELEKYLTLLLNIDADLVLTDYIQVDEDNRPFANFQFKDVPQGTEFPFEMLPRANYRSMAMHAVTYKTENLRGIDYIQTEGISYTDQEWIYKPFLAVKKVCYYKLYLYRYLVGRAGQTMDIKVRLKSMKQENVVLKSLIRTYSESDCADDYHRDYLKERLYVRLRDTYSVCISSKDESTHEILAETDKYLKDVMEELYEETENYTIPGVIKYNYIKHWRQNHKPMPSIYAYSMMLAKKFESLKARIKG